MRRYYVRLYMPSVENPGELEDATRVIEVEALTREHANDLTVRQYPVSVIVDIVEADEEHDDSHIELEDDDGHGSQDS